MAISPNYLPSDSIIEQGVMDCHLLSIQAAIMQQIAEAAKKTLGLDQVMPSVVAELQKALSVSGCLIVQPHKAESTETTDTEKHSLCQRTDAAEQTIRVMAVQPQSHATVGEPLYQVCCAFYQHHQSVLTQGNLVSCPGTEPQFPSAIQRLAQDCSLYAILIVPLLYRSSYWGGIILYECEQEREWAEGEIIFVRAIADQCAIAFALPAIEQRHQIELQKRQKTETALRENQRQLKALLAAVPDAIFRVSRDGIYLDWQAAKQDTLPMQPSEIIGQHLHQVLPTEVAGLLWHHVELALETQEMQMVEYQLWLHGKSHHFEARLVKSGSDDVAVIVQNITERVEVRIALQQLNDMLEQRVAERTAALREANHILRAEIIERQKVESQLRESEERFRSLVETSKDWVWEVDEEAVYTYASPNIKNLLGYEPSEVLGKTPFELMPTQERQRIAEVFASLADSRQPFTGLENTNIHKDGHWVILESSGVPIVDAKGVFRGYRGIDRDITERKQTEKEFQFLYAIARALFESQDFYAALGVALEIVCEATGWDFGEAWVPRVDGRVLECSPAWFSKNQNLDAFRQASETLTIPPNVSLPGRVWVSQQPEWRRNVSAESHEIYRRAELAKAVGLKAALGIPVIGNEGVLAVLVFYRFESKNEDQRLIELISASTELGLMIQRKQAEGEIRKALEAEKELTELKSRFITLTSHEFRTPLTTIQSSAELLEHYSHKWTEEKKLSHLHRIQISVKHMTRLLNDVLILGKADAGKLKLETAPLDLETFCRTLAEELQFNDNQKHPIIFTGVRQLENWSSHENNSHLFAPPLSPQFLFPIDTVPTWEMNSSLPYEPIPNSARTPCMDEKLLRQILENLLTNALKYSPSGSPIEFTLSYSTAQAVFQIRDQGIGIPEEDRQRLFEAFHRATNVGTIAGTGLGLAIVKKCVDLHKGQIVLESEVGVGTTFTVTLPIYNSVSTHDKNSSD
jgi:PAS domain S-box-containing protein